MFYYESSQRYTDPKMFDSISLLYFVIQCFDADKFIYDLPNVSVTNTKQTLKDRDISGIGP